MGRFIFSIIFWGVIATVTFLSGARYGAPGWLSNAATPAFEAIETKLNIDTEAVVPTATSVTAEPEIEPASDAGTETTSAISTNEALSINQHGIDLIKEEEGLRLESYSAGGRSYIGYGHQQKPGDASSITEAQAEALLRKDVEGAEAAVQRMVTVPVNVNEFSAMVSFAYNLGEGGFSRSRVLAAINTGDHSGAAEAFLTHNTVGGEFNQVIYDRRVKERALFLKPV